MDDYRAASPAGSPSARYRASTNNHDATLLAHPGKRMSLHAPAAISTLPQSPTIQKRSPSAMSLHGGESPALGRYVTYECTQCTQCTRPWYRINVQLAGNRPPRLCATPPPRARQLPLVEGPSRQPCRYHLSPSLNRLPAPATLPKNASRGNSHGTKAWQAPPTQAR